MQTLIGSIEERIMVQHRLSEASKRLKSIPGIGLIGATAIAATVPDPKVFGSGRAFAAGIGLVPREDSTGGKQKLGPISKRGDRYLRRILVVEPAQCCDTRATSRRNILGSQSFSNANRSRWSR